MLAAVLLVGGLAFGEDEDEEVCAEGKGLLALFDEAYMFWKEVCAAGGEYAGGGEGRRAG